MIASGFYQVVFVVRAPGAVGAVGVVIVDGETVRGGDDQHLYAGALKEAEGKVTATIRVKPLTAHTTSVFGTRGDPFELTLSGSVDAEGFSVSGPSPVGGAGISIRGRRVAGLDL